MGKATKIILITAAILITAGIIITVIGYNFVSRNKPVSAATYEKKEQTITDGFDSISVDEISADIKLVPSTDGTTKIEYYDSEQLEHKICVKSGTLEVSVHDNALIHGWWEYVVNFDWTFSSFDDTTKTTVIYLPEASYKSLTAHGVSSDIEVDKAFTFEKVKFTTTSGDIKSYCVITDSFTANTTSGDVSVSNIDLELADVSTVSGEVIFNDSKISRKIDIDTTSGDVTLNNVTSENTSVNTVSGDVKGTLVGDHQYETDTVSGDISLPSNIKGAASVDIDTVSGDIKFA
jgi:hypothetical protein